MRHSDCVVMSMLFTLVLARTLHHNDIKKRSVFFICRYDADLSFCRHVHTTDIMTFSCRYFYFVMMLCLLCEPGLTCSGKFSRALTDPLVLSCESVRFTLIVCGSWLMAFSFFFHCDLNSCDVLPGIQFFPATQTNVPRTIGRGK